MTHQLQRAEILLQMGIAITTVAGRRKHGHQIEVLRTIQNGNIDDSLLQELREEAAKLGILESENLPIKSFKLAAEAVSILL